MKKQLLLLIAISFLALIFSTVQAQTANESLGDQAGISITSGDYNTMVGDSAAYTLTSGSFNVMVGARAGFKATNSSDNTFIGRSAGYSTTTGVDNTFIGKWAGTNNTATDNTFIGSESGLDNTTGVDNVFIGEQAGYKNTDGDDNVFIGEDAGYNNTTANDNTFVGNNAGRTNTTGYKNAFFGNDAGYDNKDGYNNTFVGDSAGTDVGTGIYNTFVGQASGAATEYADFNTFIGVRAGYDNNRTNNTGDANRNTYVGVLTGSSNRQGEDNVGMGSFASFGSSGQPSPVGTTLGTSTNRSRTTFVGADADAGHNDVTLLGYSTRVDGQYGIAIGNEADLASATGGIGIGYQAILPNNGDHSVGIGYQVNIAENDAVGIGRAVDVDNEDAVAIGANSIVQNNGAIVIGYGANSMDLIDNTGGDPDATYNIALGYNASTSAFNSVAIGNAASAAIDNTMVLGGATNPLSVGVGTDAPNANASLELADTNKGLLVNRLTTSQKATLGGNLTAAENGMVVFDTELKGLYFWDGTQWLSALEDNLGDHTATTDIEVVDNNLDFGNTEGVGVRFWNGNDNYKIAMGNSSEYQYGVVTDYSIKNSMNATAGRGWTWGVIGETPIAAIDNTGKLQIANTMTIGAYTLPNTDGTDTQVLSTDGAGVVTWADATVNTDNQDLSLSSDVLSLTNAATTIDLSGYLDNTDAQGISLSTNTLSITGNAGTVDLSSYLDNTDNQDLSLSGNVLSLTNDVTGVDLSAYINTDTQLTEAQVDTYVSNNGYLTTFTEVDGDATNEIQDINLSGTNLSISSGSTVDLSALQDGTGSDNQDLTSATLTGVTLAIDIESGNAVNVDLSPLLTDLEDRVTALEAVSTPSGTDMTPQQFNYQAVVRDTAGDVLANTLVNFQISILQTTSTGTSVYVETHSATTSTTGLTNFEIGSGTLVSGDFATIDWAGDTHYLQIDADITGGTSYTLLGTSQLVSVPYALHAKTADYLSGISTAKLKYELDVKTEKIKSLEDKVLKLEKMMLKILDKK